MLQLFCDFDGTVCQQDTLQWLLERHAPPHWLRLEQAWREGRLTTQECLRQQLALITLAPADLAELVVHTRLTPGFAEFDHWRQTQGLSLTLLSDGMEPVIQAVLTHHGIKQVTLCANQLDLASRPQRVHFPFAHAEHPGCAMCKGHYLKQARQPGATLVYIGDGLSDRCAASQADALFAKAGLADYCQQQGIAFHPWQDFYGIRHQLERWQKLGEATPLIQEFTP